MRAWLIRAGEGALKWFGNMKRLSEEKLTKWIYIGKMCRGKRKGETKLEIEGRTEKYFEGSGPEHAWR